MLLTTPLWIRKTVSAAYVAAVTVLSLLPSRDLPDVPMFPHADKVIHFFMYGFMAFFLCWASPGKTATRLIHYTGIILFCTAYGMLMEFLQGTLAQLDRTFSWNDGAANLAGAIVFTAAAWRILNPNRPELSA